MNFSMRSFQMAIKNYLDGYAEVDEMFARSYSKEYKNIEECCNYILSEMQKAAKNGCIGATDDDVYSLAIHYYDEDNIKNVSPITNSLIVSNHIAEIELTEEEKTEIKKQAIDKYYQMELNKLQSKSKRKSSATQATDVQPLLFDF